MTSDNNNPKREDDEKTLGSLLRLAGERPEIPLSIESRVYHRVQREWQASTQEPNADKVYSKVRRSWKLARLHRWLVPTGVAASAILAVVILSQPDPMPPVAVATIADVIAPATATQRFAQGSAVFEGDIVETGAGAGLSLFLARNATMRIDENTRVRVESADHFALLSGRIYVDSGQFIYRDSGLVIDTPFGVVRDIGTQFAISAENAALEVAVREGQVELAYESKSVTARMGERLTRVHGQSASISELDTHDPYWYWIVDLTPEFDMTNKSLLDVLKWAARETGRQLQFETDESRMFAMRTDVRGSISGLTPDEALEAILSVTTLEYRIETDRVVLLLPAN